MSKIDFKKTIPSYKAKAGVFQIIEIPKMKYLMIDGKGDPNTSKEFKDAVSTLYPVAYKIKFKSKLELKKDYTVPPLEALWWADDMQTFSSKRNKTDWKWTVMLMVPNWITEDIFKDALEQSSKKIPEGIQRKIRLGVLDEGLCVQTLHIGSFDSEGEVLEKMHNEFMPENMLRMTKNHHEVYLSDFRKVAPEKLRTILRQPVERI